MKYVVCHSRNRNLICPQSSILRSPTLRLRFVHNMNMSPIPVSKFTVTLIINKPSLTTYKRVNNFQRRQPCWCYLAFCIRPVKDTVVLNIHAGSVVNHSPCLPARQPSSTITYTCAVRTSRMTCNCLLLTIKADEWLGVHSSNVEIH